MYPFDALDFSEAEPRWVGDVFYSGKLQNLQNLVYVNTFI